MTTIRDGKRVHIENSEEYNSFRDSFLRVSKPGIIQLFALVGAEEEKYILKKYIELISENIDVDDWLETGKAYGVLYVQERNR